MVKERFVLVGLMLVSIIFLVVVVSAQPVIDQNIENLFETQGEIYVTVMLKVPENLEYKEDMSKEEISALFNQRKQSFEQIQSDFLSTFSLSEFRLTKRYSTINGFRGNITSSGFEKLKNNPNVLSINIPLKGEYLSNEDSRINVESSCRKDSDCMVVQNGCCGCNSGGTATTINKNYLDYWNKNLEEKCEGVGCLAFISEHWSCFAEPKCVNKQCVLTTDEDAENGGVRINYLWLWMIIIFIIIIYFVTRKKKK